MGKMFWIAMAASALAGPASALDADPRLALHCQEDSNVRDCTAANGRIDAEHVAARNKLAFYVFGGRGAMRKVYDRMEARMKTAESRNKARAASAGGR